MNAVITGNRKYHFAHIWHGVDHWLLSDGDPFTTDFVVEADDPVWAEAEARKDWARRVAIAKDEAEARRVSYADRLAPPFVPPTTYEDEYYG